MMPKIEETLTICASRLRLQVRQEGAGAVHHAPEIDVEQPVHLRLVDLLELPEQRHAGIVDEDVERGMRRDRLARELRDVVGLADIDAMQADLALTRRSRQRGSSSPASSRSASARSQPRLASSIASARPMPLAAPVMAAAPLIAVMRAPSVRFDAADTRWNGSHAVTDYFPSLEPNQLAPSGLNPTRFQNDLPKERANGTGTAISRDRA